MTIERTDEYPERRYTEAEMRLIAQHAVDEAFTRMGMAADNPIEMQRDFSHLREWRLATESMRTKSLLTLTAVLVTGVLGAIWVALREYLVR